MAHSIAAFIFLGTVLGAAHIQAQQDNPQADEQIKAQIGQMRSISRAIKACPKVAEYPDKGNGTFNLGPPANVTWDVKPNSSVRAPYLGYIEFFLPREFSASEKYCAKNKELCARLMSVNSFRYRFELDLGPDGLELTKILVKSDSERDKEWRDARSDESCWQRAARPAKRK